MALGVGFFAGLRVTKTAMIHTADDYLRDSAFFDDRLLSTLGYDDDAVTAVAETDGVVAAEGMISLDAAVQVGDETERIFKFYSITEKVNRVTLTAGRMPETPDECVADASFFTEADLGTRLSVSDSGGEDGASRFSCTAYTLVGLVESPLYLNFERGTTHLGNGSIAAFVYLLPDGFNVDYYTEIDLTLDAAAETGIYTYPYADALDGARDAVTAAAEAAAQGRYDALRNEAQDKLDNAEAAYADGLKDYTDGENAYRENLAAYEDGEAEWAAGAAELDRQKASVSSQRSAARRQLTQAQAQLDENAAQLQSARDELALQTQALADSDAQLQARQTQLDEQRTAAGAAWAQAAAEIDAAIGDIDAQLAALEGSGETEKIVLLQQMRAQLESKRADARAQYDAALAEMDT